jgi:hypothetical protein
MYGLCSCSRVQAHAAACVCNLYDGFDESDTQSLKSFLGPTVQTLLSAFVNGPLYLQEQIVSSLCESATSGNTDSRSCRGYRCTICVCTLFR